MLRASLALLLLVAATTTPTASAWIDPIPDCDLPVETRCMYCADDAGTPSDMRHCSAGHEGYHYAYCVVYTAVACIA